MSPIEVSANPLRANNFRLASRIFVLARGSPLRGRVTFGLPLGDWSASSHRRDYPKQLTRRLSPNLFGKLVPSLAIANSSSQLPAARLRNLLDDRPQAAQPLSHNLASRKTPQLERETLTAFTHNSQRSPQPPVRNSELGDVSGVDAAVVSGEIVIAEDRADVQVVLFVRLHDLELQHRQVRQGKGQGNSLQPALEIDPMAEIGLVDEDVDLTPVAPVPEIEAAVAVEHVELPVTGVTQHIEQSHHLVLGGCGGGKVDVGVLPCQRRLTAAGTEHRHRHPSEHPQRDFPFGSGLGDSPPLGNGVRNRLQGYPRHYSGGISEASLSTSTPCRRRAARAMKKVSSEAPKMIAMSRRK